MARATRHGLTPCSQCGRHVRVEATCSFCGEALGRAASTSPLGLGVRGGLVAAALFGAPLLGCGGGQAQLIEAQADTSEGPADTAAPPATPEPQTPEPQPPEAQPQPAYGVPPRWRDVIPSPDTSPSDTSDEVDSRPSIPEPQPQPLYGIPPDRGQ